MKDGATRATGECNILEHSALLVHDGLYMVLPIVLLDILLVG